MIINLDHVSLDPEQETELKGYLLNLFESALNIKLEQEARPYVNQKEIAKYFGVSASTINSWVALGCPVANVDGRKLYGKESIKNWLKSFERPEPRADPETSPEKEESTDNTNSQKITVLPVLNEVKSVNRFLK